MIHSTIPTSPIITPSPNVREMITDIHRSSITESSIHRLVLLIRRVAGISSRPTLNRIEQLLPVASGLSARGLGSSSGLLELEKGGVGVFSITVFQKQSRLETQDSRLLIMLFLEGREDPG